MIRRFKNSRMEYLVEANTISNPDSIVTRRKGLKVLKYIIYPWDMSTPNVSMTCPTVTAKSSTSFRASSSLQVTVKPSPNASKSAREYRDFRILRVRLADCLISVRMMSRDLISRLSTIWGHALRKRTCSGRRSLPRCPPSP
jgi:hypothetical protein